MPIDYEIADGLLSAKIHGAFSAAEFAEYIETTAQDPRYRPQMPRLIEIADDASFPPSLEIIAGAAVVGLRARGKGARFAYVARTPFAVGIASMFTGNAGLSGNTQIFESVDDAKAWLASRAEEKPT